MVRKVLNDLVGRDPGLAILGVLADSSAMPV